MNLDKDTNYIVSGLERSGTSMLMQVLHVGGFPVSYDQASRPPDDDNPKGYFELEGGKIINKLMDGSFSLDNFKGQFIKITAYGLKFLPPGNYKIIYTERNIEEILDSMEKMARIEDTNRNETREVFVKLNRMIKDLISKKENLAVLFVNYNAIIASPRENIQIICDFIGSPEADLERMVSSVDDTLYRKRRD